MYRAAGRQRPRPGIDVAVVAVGLVEEGRAELVDGHRDGAEAGEVAEDSARQGRQYAGQCIVVAGAGRATGVAEIRAVRTGGGRSSPVTGKVGAADQELNGHGVNPYETRGFLCKIVVAEIRRRAADCANVGDFELDAVQRAERGIEPVEGQVVADGIAQTVGDGAAGKIRACAETGRFGEILHLHDLSGLRGADADHQRGDRRRPRQAGCSRSSHIDIPS